MPAPPTYAAALTRRAAWLDAQAEVLRRRCRFVRARELGAEATRLRIIARHAGGAGKRLRIAEAV